MGLHGNIQLGRLDFCEIFNRASMANEDFAAIIMGHPGGILHGRATSAGIPQGRQRFSQISADLYLTNLI
jgi:hypothetical protein